MKTILLLSSLGALTLFTGCEADDDDVHHRSTTTATTTETRSVQTPVAGATTETTTVQRY
jgi:hypothetical protein